MLKLIYCNILLLSSCAVLCFALCLLSTKVYQSEVILFVFTCRSFVLDMTMETEASAVMLTSCKLSKGVSSCPFSSCLGMHCSYNIN